MKRVLDNAGVSIEDVRGFVAEHPEMQRPMYKFGHRKGVVGVAANFALHAAERMKAERRTSVAVC
jgi:signal recognition particle GTPase